MTPAEWLGARIGMSLRFLTEAWLLMLALGALHSLIADVPALSFGITFVLVTIARLMGLAQPRSIPAR